MIFGLNIALCATLVSLALVPSTRGVEINVVVGGSAGLVFTPSSVVRIQLWLAFLVS